MGLMEKIKSDWDEMRREIDEAALRNHPFKDGVCKWFVHKDRTDLDLFFGPLNGDEEFIELDDNANIFTVLAKAGAFPSATAARKNWKNVAKKIGWDVDVTSIPEGFTMFTVGKKKLDVVILK